MDRRTELTLGIVRKLVKLLRLPDGSITVQNGIVMVGGLPGEGREVEVYQSLREKVEKYAGVLSGALDAAGLQGGTEGVSWGSFLAWSCCAAQLCLLNNDWNLLRFKERLGGKSDCMFGYGDMVDWALYQFVEETKFIRGRQGIQEGIQSGLLASIRSLDAAGYVKDGGAEMDLCLIDLLMGRQLPDQNERVLSFIKTDHNYNTYCEQALSGILGVYKYLYQDGYSLQPYAGVFSFSKVHLMKVDKVSHTLQKSRDSYTVFNSVYSALRKVYPVKESASRQFDVVEILDSGETPVYFPRKSVEFAFGLGLTSNLSEDIYRPADNAASWDIYSKENVRQNLRMVLLDGVYCLLERNFDFARFGVDPKKGFRDGKFDGLDWDRQVFPELTSERMRVKVLDGVKCMKRSLCAGVVVVRYNALGGSVNQVWVRLVDVCGTVPQNLGRALFSGLTPNADTTDFAPGLDISEGAVYDGQRLPFRIYDFKHDFNEALTSAVPLFGYKAIKMFLERGEHINWSRVLLGEDVKSTPLFAELGNPDSIPMQGQVLHNIIAGSRSGKGVMTMNMLASAIAAGKAVFYLDRKPDIAIMFANLSGGNMFLVNGGQYNSQDDYNGMFADGFGQAQEGVCLRGFNACYAKMPGYLHEVFGSKGYYDNEGALADYVYLRGVMFAMGIILARIDVGDPAVYDKLGGKDGVVLVLDEISNWQTNFEAKYLYVSGKFGEQYLSSAVKEKYQKTRNKVRVLEAQLEQATEKTRIKLELDLQMEKEALSKYATEYGCYCTTLIDRLNDSGSAIMGAARAGFKNREGNLTDIFVIGQTIEREGVAVYSKNTSGTLSGHCNNKSFLRGWLDCFLHDWFMGHNAEHSNYMGESASGSQAKHWLGKSYWGYVRDADMGALRSECPDGVKWFKPYLVLNDNRECLPTENIREGAYAFVTQCRDRVNSVKAGLWEEARVDLLADGVVATPENPHYDELHPGMAFPGLVTLTKATNSGVPFNPGTDLNKSREIADFVAGRMGYSSYQELLFDFTPEGLFGVTDVVAAIKDPASFHANRKLRLEPFFTYGFLSDAMDSPAGDDGEGDDGIPFDDPVDEPQGDGLGDGQGDDGIPFGDPVDELQGDGLGDGQVSGQQGLPQDGQFDGQVDVQSGSVTGQDAAVSSVGSPAPRRMTDAELDELSRLVVEASGVWFDEDEMPLALNIVKDFWRKMGW